MSTRKSRWRLFTAVLATAVIAATMPAGAEAAGGPNLALGKQVQASSSNAPYGAGNANDGNAGHLLGERQQRVPAVDPGRPGRRRPRRPGGAEAAAPTGAPGRRPWRSRAAPTARTSTTCRRRPGYVFNPATGNTVTINFTAATTRYVRVNVTANTGWPAGQLSEFEIYGAAGHRQAPTAPGNLAYTQPASGQIRLTWNASTDNVGRHRLPDLRQRRAAGDRRRHRADLHRHPAGHGHRRVLRPGRRRRRATRRRTATTSPAPAPTRRPRHEPGPRQGDRGELGHVFTFVATNANDNNVGDLLGGQRLPEHR